MKGFEVLERENDAYTDSVGGSGTGHRRMKSISHTVNPCGRVGVRFCLFVFQTGNFNPQCKFGSLNE